MAKMQKCISKLSPESKFLLIKLVTLALSCGVRYEFSKMEYESILSVSIKLIYGCISERAPRRELARGHAWCIMVGVRLNKGSICQYR